MKTVALTRPSGREEIRRHVLDYLELTKPRLASLVLVTTAAGYWLGARPLMSWMRLLSTIVGTGLVVGGANALNQWIEQDADALMQRTCRRPLPTGRLSSEHAHHFGFTLIALGSLLLFFTCNALSALLAMVAAATYLAGYTPLKRMTSLCTLVGAIPGALPPMIGWAAARDSLGLPAWGLFVLLFFWQLPHFLAIAVLYREDYARAGFKMLPVIEPDGRAAARQTVLYGLALLPVSLWPTLIGVSGPIYFMGALLLGLLFVVATVGAAVSRSRGACQRLFLASVLYLPLLLTLLACDKQAG